MDRPHISKEEMLSRVVRFDDLTKQGDGLPLMFIDSMLPGHHRMNYVIVGDSASENPDYEPMLTQPHKYSMGMMMTPPGCGPAYHTHEYVELFIILHGQWRFYWGNESDPAKIDGEVTIGPWDVISFPPWLWRGFENAGDDTAWCINLLEEHDPFSIKDPHWSPQVIKRCEEAGFTADEQGKMIKPANFDEINRRMQADLSQRLERFKAEWRR